MGGMSFGLANQDVHISGFDLDRIGSLTTPCLKGSKTERRDTIETR